MKQECNHKINIPAKYILSAKFMLEREFDCIFCDRKMSIKLKIPRFQFILSLISLLFLSFSTYFSKEYIISVNIVIKYLFAILASIGFVVVEILAVNGLIWLFQNKLKYVEVENNKKAR